MENTQTITFDSILEDEGTSFTLLPEGDYDFVVKNFERGNFPGSGKIPPCLKAIITVEVKSEQGNVTLKTDLMLAKVVEWKLCAFFRSIGQKKHGEPLKPNWNTVIGSTGRAHIKQRHYTNKNGEDRVVNEIDYFLDKVDFGDDDDFLF